MTNKTVPRTKTEAGRIAADKRDAEFFAARKARDAANLEKTLKLRAMRLAHEATMPKPAAKPARGIKKAVVKKVAVKKA